MRRFVVLVALLVAATLVVNAQAPSSLEGRWMLASQTYESGQRQLGTGETPVWLDFSREGGSWSGVLTWEGRSSTWPAYPSPAGFAPLGPQVRLSYDSDGLGVSASYEVLPPGGDDTRLLVEEHYRIDDEGRMVGTMRVRLASDERSAGGFTWHRVFEREE